MKVNKLSIPVMLSIVSFQFSCVRENSKGCEKIVEGIKVEKSSYDIGEHKVNGTASKLVPFNFVLQNTTNKKVELDSVETSCSCLNLKHTPIIIKAEGCDSIVGTIDLSEIRGSFSRSVYVCFFSGEIMLLRVKGKVEQELQK